MKQIEILIPPEFKELFNPKWRNILYYGGRGSTKSHSVARALIILARSKTLRILCTREIQNTIEDSSFQLLKDIIELYELTDFSYTKTSIINTVTGSEFLFKGLRKTSAQSVKSLEGIDIVWVEECQSVTKDSLDILSPTIRKEGSQLIFTFNRITELDPVYVKYIRNPPPDTYSRMVNYTDIIKYGIFPEVLRKEMEHDKEHNPELYPHIWLGEPIAQADNAILSRSSVLKAMERTIEPVGGIVVGVDVARLGNDRTVFHKRKGLKTTGTAEYRKLRTNEVCDKLEAFILDGVAEDLTAEYKRDVLVKVDDTGVGGGVTDIMMERGWNVEAINFGASPYNKDKYPDWISEAWFSLKELLPEIDLPEDPDLLHELSNRLWKMTKDERRQVESKDDYKKRGNPSPDKADACIICYSQGDGIGIDDIDI